MKKEIEVKTYLVEVDSENKIHHHSQKFSDWKDAKEYILSRLELARRNESFKIEIGDVRFSVYSKERFTNISLVEKEFNNSLEKISVEDAERKRNMQSRIEIRIAKAEKEKILKKCKKLGLNISEYTRQLYLYGEVVIVSEQTKRDVRGMATNLNQIAKRVNSGAIAPSTVIYELQNILDELNKTYRR